MTAAIVKSVDGYGDYPFEAISAHALAGIQAYAASTRNKERKQLILRLLRCLECFLQVTGQQLRQDGFQQIRFGALFKLFAGALNSNRLFGGTLHWKYDYTVAWFELARALGRKSKATKLPDIEPMIRAVHPRLQEWAEAFDKIELNEEKVWLWRGWHSTNRNGKLTRMPLYPIYRRLGRKFTERFFIAADEYFRTRKAERIPCLRQLANFIAEYPGPLTTADLLTPRFVTHFWREFLASCLSDRGDSPRPRNETLLCGWNAFRAFVKDYVIPSGLLAEQWGELPCTELRHAAGRTHVRMTPEGYEVRTKLLTHIPLQVSDDQAIQLLFITIEQDLLEITSWAEWECKRLWQRYQEREKSAPLGTVRFVRTAGSSLGGHRWLTDRTNPDHYNNACATFSHHGFQTAADAPINLLYPLPLTLTAEELALPTTHALFPHAILLVSEHPKITVSFLQSVELYDKNGKLTGFIEKDGACRLIGYKSRCGASRALQDILLTRKTADLVRQIIALTQPIREYLRTRNDDQWRYLFLTSCQGFAHPSRMDFTSSTHSKEGMERTLQGLANTSKRSMSELTDLVERLSLPSVRASAGVLVYLKTRDAEKMSKALGHSEYSPRLLQRYLPQPILDFFQERWIRIFQTGVTVDAMKDSPHVLAAAGFSSVAELHEFLSHHALRITGGEPRATTLCTSGREVAFGLNSEILTALIGIQTSDKAAAPQVIARATFWSDLTEALVRHIDTSDRPDLQSYLLEARKNAQRLAQCIINGQ